MSCNFVHSASTYRWPSLCCIYPAPVDVCVLLLLLQRVEEEERAEEAAGARITKKKKTNKSKQGG